MKEADFMKIWTNGLVFAIHNGDAVGRRHFDADREWAQMPSFDRDQAVNRQSLASFSIGLPPILNSAFF
jgi:hypothetical protein